jgi:hypothetical protein
MPACSAFVERFCGCGLMPTSASKPAGCSACGQPARRHQGLGGERQRFERPAKASAPASIRLDFASRSASGDRFGNGVAGALRSPRGRRPIVPRARAICALRTARRSSSTDRRRRAVRAVDLVHRPRHERRLRERRARASPPSPLSISASAFRAPVKSFSGADTGRLFSRRVRDTPTFYVPARYDRFRYG